MLLAVGLFGGLLPWMQGDTADALRRGVMATGAGELVLVDQQPLVVADRASPEVAPGGDGDVARRRGSGLRWDSGRCLSTSNGRRASQHRCTIRHATTVGVGEPRSG